jgi:hypothetical protein
MSHNLGAQVRYAPGAECTGLRHYEALSLGGENGPQKAVDKETTAHHTRTSPEVTNKSLHQEQGKAGQQRTTWVAVLHSSLV